VSERPRIAIGTPTANGLVSSDHVNALMAMTSRLHAQGIATRYQIVDGPDLLVQSDILARHFLASDCTHLLLVGRDIAFPPSLCERLLAARRRLVGAIYPRAAPDFGRVAGLAAVHGLDRALALATEWMVEPIASSITVTGGFCEVAALPLGFILIERQCLVEMRERIALPRYAAQAAETVDAFFRDVPEDGCPSADAEYAFCRRWRAAGGEVWADATAEVRRVADFRFGMPFSAYLKTLAAPS
jgi:hypothetical protein